MIEALQDLRTTIEAWFFQAVVQPAMFDLGLMAYVEDAYDWLDFALLGLLQIVVVYAICRPLEAWRPVERWTDAGPVRTDVLYTFINRLGLVPLIVFVLLNPAALEIDGLLRENGIVAPTLEQLIPGLLDAPILTFFLYVVILDFADYWRHRFQHRFDWWWALHSLHHAQRQMTFWSDDRNHVLDDVLQAVWLGSAALLIGVPPAQFPLIVMVLRLVESLSHANARLSFGRIGERLVVDPHFHRVHHSLEHAAPPFDRTRGVNFAVILPIWDILFGTAKFGSDYPRTGDLTSREGAASGGYLRQQWEGLRRLGRALTGSAA